MKRSHFLFAMVATGLMMFSSCKSSTDTGGGFHAYPVVMTANVNGNAWSGIIPFTGYNGAYLDFSAGDSNSVIAIYYTQTDTGTYPINGNTGDSCFATYDLRQNEYISHTNSGTIHFSVLNSSHVTGTFNFVATDTLNDSARITQGTFDIAR